MFCHPRRLVRHLRLGLLLAGFVCLVGCGEQTAGTALSVEVEVAGSVAAEEAVFTNDRGWAVTLETARLLIGPVFFYSAEARASLWDRAFGLRRAYACPAEAQFDRGTVIGELRRQVVADLLQSEATSLGVAHGETGTCRMVELHIHPPEKLADGPTAEELAAHGGESVVISGVARKDDAEVFFAGTMTLPEEGTLRIVSNIAADVIFDGRPGAALVRVHLERWLQNADFGLLLDEQGECLEVQDDGVCRITEDSQVYVAWMTGIRSRYAYDLAWRGE